MSFNEQPSRPLSLRWLVIATLGALVAAILIVFGAILPAEYNRDPLGLGKLSGMIRLWAPDENLVDVNDASGPRAREYPKPFRTDVVEIPLGGFLSGVANSELEYKVRMQKDATVLYAWEVVGAADVRDFHYDQHGHTTPAPGESVSVATYKQAFGLSQQGSMSAPFDGIQGWQFSNSSEQPVVVRLRLSGYYDLIPAGEDGNLAGIIANVPASQARPATAPSS